MGRTRTTWFLPLVMSLTSMAWAATTDAPAATAPATASTATTATPQIAAADDTSCQSCLKCPCGCSPLAGAWIGKLDCTCSSSKESILQTFKFAPLNGGCTKFVVNSQSVTRLAKVAKFWPEACEQTEFVGTACTDAWNNIKVTAISYGVKRCATTTKTSGPTTATATDTTGTTCPTTTDKIVFLAVLTAQIETPVDCLTCSTDQKDPNGNYTGPCQEPKELGAKIFLSFFDAAQDQDQDGFPDSQCGGAVLCVRGETCLKRVELTEPCDAQSESFVACLGACPNVTTTATGRAFIKIDGWSGDVDVVLTVQDLQDVTKAALQINGADVLVVFPVPPDTKSRDGDCSGLLTCAALPAKDFLGSLKGKKPDDLLQALKDGKVSVVVSTKKSPNGEIGGLAQDP